MKQLTLRTSLYWGVPLTLLVASAYNVNKARAHQPLNPTQFVSSCETRKDIEKLKYIRDEWYQKNNGIGLKDVSRSGGGV
ncbi:unnamed protein product [Cunninghamella blakesleeana]